MTTTGAEQCKRLAIIGAGAWGTALAIAVRGGNRITDIPLWAHEHEVAADINARRVNEAFLPGLEIPPGVHATADLGSAIGQADVALIAVPAQHVRAVAERCAGALRPGTILVLCAKGIELNSGKLMSEVLAEACPPAPLPVLPGPPFAAEVAAGQPTAVTLACREGPAGGGAPPRDRPGGARRLVHRAPAAP